MSGLSIHGCKQYAGLHLLQSSFVLTLSVEVFHVVVWRYRAACTNKYHDLEYDPFFTQNGFSSANVDCEILTSG